MRSRSKLMLSLYRSFCKQYVDTTTGNVCVVQNSSFWQRKVFSSLEVGKLRIVLALYEFRVFNTFNTHLALYSKKYLFNVFLMHPSTGALFTLSHQKVERLRYGYFLNVPRNENLRYIIVSI